MTYTVTYRNKAGQMVNEAFDAESRTALFKMLNERGVTATSVAEGVSPSVKSPKASASGKRKIYAWVLAIPAVAAIILFFVPDGGIGVRSEVKLPRKKQIREVAPSVSNVKLPEVQAPSNTAEMIVLPNGVITNKPKTIADAIKMVRLKPGFHSYKSVDDVFAQTNRFQIGPYKSLNLKSSTEAQLSLIATRPRTMPIPPMPPLPPMMEKDFERAMDNYLTAVEGDSDADIAQKKEIELLKDMMRHYVKEEGMSPARALQEVENQHNRAANMYQLYRREYIKLVDEGSPDAEAFYGAAIDKLKESGAPIFDREAKHIQE